MRVVPTLIPKAAATAKRSAEASANLMAMPVKGGVPRSPILMTAQVVPQMRQTTTTAKTISNVLGWRLTGAAGMTRQCNHFVPRRPVDFGHPDK